MNDQNLDAVITFTPPAPKETNKRYVIFFRDNVAGWGSCGIALNALTEPDRRYVTKPVGRKQDSGDILESLDPSDHVYLLGLGLDRELADAIHAKVEKFVLLDNTKTSEKKFKDAEYATVALDKSSALLTFEHFFPEMLNDEYSSLPIPVRLVDNYDLWKKTDTKVNWLWVVGFHLFVVEHIGDYSFWRELMAMVDLPSTTYNIIRQKAIDFEASVDEIIKSADFSEEVFKDKKFIVFPCAKHNLLISDAIFTLATKNNRATDFTASFFEKDNEVVIKLFGNKDFNNFLSLAESVDNNDRDSDLGFTITVGPDEVVKDKVLDEIRKGIIAL